MLTFKEANYVAARLKGMSKPQALKLAGFSYVQHPERIEQGEVKAALEKYQAELVDHAIAQALIDAKEIHEFLTDALRAKITDIQNDDGTFKKLSEWPDIWQRMYEGGDVEVTFASERSHDGKTTDQKGGWDIKGKVSSVKFKFASRQKLLELAMKHKGVNAMVQSNDSKEVAEAVCDEIAKRIAAGRQRASNRDEYSAAHALNPAPIEPTQPQHIVDAPIIQAQANPIDEESAT